MENVHNVEILNMIRNLTGGVVVEQKVLSDFPFNARFSIS